MRRLAIGLALAGLLTACTTQGDGTTEEPAGTAAGETGAAAAAATAPCSEAFAPLAEQEVESLSDLGDFQEELGPTVESCESIADWVAGAGEVVPGEVNPNTARILLGISCTDLSLSNTPICDELEAT
jgi:hypothetical protein